MGGAAGEEKCSGPDVDGVPSMPDTEVLYAEA